MRPVPRGVADRPVDDHLAVAAHAELHRRLEPAAVEALDRLPDRLDASRLDADAARVDLGGERVVTSAREGGIADRLKGLSHDPLMPAV